MAPTVQRDWLKVFTCHGLDIDIPNGSDQGRGDCPFCDKEGKLHINPSTGQWDCKSCGSKGNAHSFLTELWKLSSNQSSPISQLALHTLTTERKYLSPTSLEKWGLCKSVINDRWLVPGYGVDGKILQLYRYTLIKTNKGNKRRLLPTAEIGHHLHGVNLYDSGKPEVYLCEGSWNGIALWEMLGRVRRKDDGTLTPTASSKTSLLSTINVLAVPGANVFLPSWASLLKDKKVTLLFDNDYPRKHPKVDRLIPSAGYEGMKRVAQHLAISEDKPESVHYLAWDTKGGQYDPKLPDGYDIRDMLCGKVKALPLEERVGRLDKLLDRIQPIPASWVEGRELAAIRKGKVHLATLECKSWKSLVNEWRKAMKWIPGLDYALSIMLACVVSTPVLGDQLWVKIVGPPSSGKSTLCEALSVNINYIVAKSTIRGFHSGYQTDREGKEDNSLMAQLAGMTLVTKDGDTLLRAPNLPQILSEARDMYDKVSRTSYRNKSSREYNQSTTWILCGTSAIREIDASELGARFLDFVVMESIDDDIEDDILWRVAQRTNKGMSVESNCAPESQNTPELTRAMQLTGGYIDYLRQDAAGHLGRVYFPESQLRLCTRLGKLVAYMRARPSAKQDETAEREFAARLVSQHVRLAKCLAVVLNSKEVDEEVMRRVIKVALHTARGKTLEICRFLYKRHEEGTDLRQLAQFTTEAEAKLKPIVRFLRRIGAIEGYANHKTKTLRTRPKWRLTTQLHKLWSVVIEAVPELEHT